MLALLASLLLGPAPLEEVSLEWDPECPLFTAMQIDEAPPARSDEPPAGLICRDAADPQCHLEADLPDVARDGGGARRVQAAWLHRSSSPVPAGLSLTVRRSIGGERAAHGRLLERPPIA